MRYLITTIDNNPFWTDEFDFTKDWNFDKGMRAYDMMNDWYSCDGETWIVIDKK